jgi:hypothetical protein
MIDIKATEIAAWWGAVVATVVFLWDIYKWKHSGADVQVTASSDMVTFGDVPQEMQGKAFIAVEVVNLGARKTTLTHLITVYYSSFWQLLIRKRNKQFFTPNSAVDKRLPCELEPGSRWMGAILQNAELEDMSRRGYLYCGVHHTASRKAVLKRVKVSEKAAA